MELMKKTVQKRNQKIECGVPHITPDLELGQDRIVGGCPAIPGSWPWQADIQIVSIHPSGPGRSGKMKMKGSLSAFLTAALIPIVLSSEPRDILIACGKLQPHRLNSSEGFIYSPGQLHNRTYPPNSLCTYHFEVPRHEKLQLEIKYLELENSDHCEADFVEITDLQNEKLVVKYCGQMNESRQLVIDSSLVEIKFRSDAKTQSGGFLIHYKYTTDGSLCFPRELQCRNGNCVSPQKICDRTDDCGDGTDEENCKTKRNPLVWCDDKKIKADLTSGNRSVESSEVVPGSFAFHASLQLETIQPSHGHLCSGALVGSRWVLTAAHCFKRYPKPESWRIHLGKHQKFGIGLHEQIRYAKNIHFYRFRNGLEGGDLALVELNAEVEYTDYVRQACVPTEYHEVNTRVENCFTIGFSKGTGNGKKDVLKQTPVSILEWTKCDNPIESINREHQHCGHENEGKSGMCHGDNGAPLVCLSDKYYYSWSVLGVSSFQTNATLPGGFCGEENTQNVYTRISSKSSWIRRFKDRFNVDYSEEEMKYVD